MADLINDKINSILSTGAIPNDIDEINMILKHLYSRAAVLSNTIDKDTSKLSDMYRYTLKQERKAYQQDDAIYTCAKSVDNLINEYNNKIIMIELLEKKLSELEDK